MSYKYTWNGTGAISVMIAGRSEEFKPGESKVFDEKINNTVLTVEKVTEKKTIKNIKTIKEGDKK